MQVKKISVKSKILCYFLAFALSVGGLSFSMATVAEASSSVSIQTYGDITVQYQNFTKQSPSSVSENVSTSASNKYYMSYDFPISFRYGVNPVHRTQYLTGYITTILNCYVSPSSGSPTISGSSWYAQSVTSAGNGLTWNVSQEGNNSDGSIRLVITAVFDNYYLESDWVGSPDIMLRYLVNINSTSFSFNNVNYVASYYDTMSYSSSPDGDLASQIAAGINASTDIDSIISILSAVSSNTALLGNVIERLDVSNNTLSLIYQNLIGNGNFPQVLVDAIRTAMETQSPDTSTLETQQAGVEHQLGQNEAIESQVYQFHENAMKDIDFGITFPASVASAAVTVMGWLAVLWGKLGNLQFLVIAACLTGLITIVLGVVNRFVWRDTGGGRARRADKPKK